MAFCDFASFDSTPLVREPFRFVVVPNFVRSDCFAAISEAFPDVPGPGSYPLTSLHIRGAFQTLLDELQSSAFQQAIERKFGLDLTDRPTMLTLRGHARKQDGAVHTDTGTKLISVLLYMNDDWNADGGRLRLLRSQNLEEAIVEVPPMGGTLVAFQRSAASWHGHRPYVGPRRVVQFNWMTKKEAAMREHSRHRIAAYVKRLSSFFKPR